MRCWAHTRVPWGWVRVRCELPKFHRGSHTWGNDQAMMQWTRLGWMLTERIDREG